MEPITNMSNPQHLNITINRKIDKLSVFYENKGFKNFDASGKLEIKKQTCLDFALGKLEKKSLVLCGKVGNGKTHLAVAIAKNYKIERKITMIEEVKGEQTVNIKFIDADEFFITLNDCASIGKSKLKYFDELFYNELIILDDLGIANFTPAKQENLYLLVNRCYQDNHPLLITTNFTMEQLEKVDARIPSRLNEMATILSFDFNDFRIQTQTTTI